MRDMAINNQTQSFCEEHALVKALANEDTLLPKQHLLRTQILCSGHKKNVSDFVQKHFVSATNVSQFAQPKKHHGQQGVRNNVPSLTRAFRVGAIFA